MGLAAYAATGTLGANVDYYAELDALNSAYAYPTQIVDSWIRDPRQHRGVRPLGRPADDCARDVRTSVSARPARSGQRVVVALGLLALTVMQKQVLRPHTAAQIWQTTLFGLSFWAAVETSLNSIRHCMAVAAAAARPSRS